MRFVSQFGKRILQKTLFLLGKRYNYFLIRGNISPNHKFDNKPYMSGAWSVSADVVRHSSLQLISKEIEENKVEGSVAEVGVHMGDFAALINYNFPDRQIFLFDTFEGFDKRDIETDLENKHISSYHDFNNTNIDLIMPKFPHPDKVVTKKGWFPETAEGMEDHTFCFVNLDTDLFDPIYNGLAFFYPRLAPGGYIMIHDYNCTIYKGAKAAVQKYCKENDIGYVPITDTGGSVIITKSIGKTGAL